MSVKWIVLSLEVQAADCERCMLALVVNVVNIANKGTGFHRSGDRPGTSELSVSVSVVGVLALFSN